MSYQKGKTMSTFYKISSWINPFHNNNSWLESAVLDGDLDLVKTTLAAGADPNLRYEVYGECGRFANGEVNVLYTAVANKQVEITKTLLAAGAEPNSLVVIGNGSGWISLYDDAENVLMPAVRNNDMGMVNLLLSYGAQTHSYDMNNQPLRVAVDSNNLLMADLLVKNGADVNQTTCKNVFYENGYYKGRVCDTPLMNANFAEMAKLLVEHGASISGSEYKKYVNDDYFDWHEPAIIQAINTGNDQKAKLLTDAGAGIDALKNSPHFDEMILHLLKSSEAELHHWVFELDGPARLNMSEAHLAALKSDVKALIALHEAGVDVNVTDKLGYTPFHYTYFIDKEKASLAPTSRETTQETLIKMGADLNAPSCLKGHIGEPVWKTIKDMNLTKMVDESFRIKALHEVYELHYDEEQYTLTSQLVNDKSKCHAPQFAEVIAASDDIAGLDGSSIATSLHVALMPFAQIQLTQLQETVAHSEF